MTGSVVEARIRAAKQERAGALVGYLPIGYPDLATSIEAAITLTRHGVDVLELGLPYSDPVMDGPAIQAATTKALGNGFRLRHAFEAVREITRASPDVPVLCMTYYNPVLSYGVERFAADLRAAGGAGLITPDLVPDEAGEWLAASDAEGLDRVFLAAPTSSEQRIRRATELSRGFTYVVSTMGITGARSDVDSAARTLVERLRDVTDEPLAVGLGISTGQQVAEVLGYADGAIVGSRLVSALGEGLDALADAADGLAEGTRRR
ncbi:tryptophan synthase subunit alpha [Amnibacterium setariae]|uniref:Tryptophan synthase alpha chain n=1 Tax=Amnibacterium setariae TaxID=2306585 RepID=A0A3A1TWS2_9MICO|nr:tryptophan synthase subunit alpha [Amnibacterium setariae]RIX28001.1 tryptophan synthase subunit alpha [Amnibacterium setariae]